ncbi:hypothetical protein BURK2_01290 [Burkholderiales bacterium]|nr:MAG: ABC transporter permease [Burkholderiales bacterium]CAG0971034.1 hypothetical protein BURK2_01290 [Burkholderiales bacterium]
MKRNVCAFALLLALPLARGHEVQHVVETASAVVLRLNYADGRAFAFEAYEVYAAGAAIPWAVGRSDAQGRVIFLPPAEGEVRLRAFSADGHGLDLQIELPRANAAAASKEPEGRGAKLMFGAGVLLAVFGLVQLFLRRKRSR